MTRITRHITRETDAKFRNDAVIVELHPKTLFVRLKGQRSSYSFTYEDLYELGAMREAKRTLRQRGVR
jgi:hypothetical protein